MEYDFCGWATKNNLKCRDGRVIKKDAFKINHGEVVPLVYNHQYNTIDNVLGHAFLENREEGVYAYCSLNNTSAGQKAKEAVEHGDITALSICATDLEQYGSDVVHGIIREVSLVLAGANKGAFIESVVQHGLPMDDDETEGIIYTGELIEGFDNKITHADDQKNDTAKKDSDRTVGEVFDEFDEEQLGAIGIVVEEAVSDALKKAGVDPEDKKKKEGDRMAHNIFDKNSDNTADVGTYLSHADGVAIIEAAKQCGSLQAAMKSVFGDDLSLVHSVPTTGMTVVDSSSTEGKKTAGIKGMPMLYPDYKTTGLPPEFISRDMGWVGKVLGSVTKLPYERIRAMYADITEDEARAKGYVTGKQKWPEVFSILTRAIDGQTIYKLQKVDRDDILQITEFELIPWLKQEMGVMLDEEKARAILIGDGRLVTDPHKIKEDKIIPVVKDVPLFNISKTVTVSSTDSKAAIAETLIDEIIKVRKKYKGSGEPSFFTTEDVITEMLLLKDKVGRRLYKTMDELATALRVKEIIPVEPMSGYKDGSKELVGSIVNLKDYATGQNPKATRNSFEGFDINFNKHEYLIEERFSGCLRKPFSAITVWLTGGSLSDDETSSDSSDSDEV